MLRGREHFKHVHGEKTTANRTARMGLPAGIRSILDQKLLLPHEVACAPASAYKDETLREPQFK